MAFLTDDTRAARVPGWESGYLAKRIAARAALALSAVRERRALAALDADRLADLGIDARAAMREAKRPFWSVKARR